MFSVYEFHLILYFSFFILFVIAFAILSGKVVSKESLWPSLTYLPIPTVCLPVASPSIICPIAALSFHPTRYRPHW